MDMWDRREIFSWFGKYLMATAMVAVVIMVYGFIPKTVTGWVIIFLFGLPIRLATGWMGRKILNERISKSIDPSKRTVSPARLSYLLFAMLICLGVALLIWGIFEESITKHFILKPWWLWWKR